MEVIAAKCFNTQPPEGGWTSGKMLAEASKFQHTAARRRLDGYVQAFCHERSFNTQPPEGGWQPVRAQYWFTDGFNTQPPEGGCKSARAAHSA